MPKVKGQSLVQPRHELRRPGQETHSPEVLRSIAFVSPFQDQTSLSASASEVKGSA